MREKFVLIPMLLLLAGLAYSLDAFLLLANMSSEIALSVFATAMGFLINLLATKFGNDLYHMHSKQLDQYTGNLLIRRVILKTFLRLFTWNFLASCALVAVGLISFGVLPLVWIFLNLGVSWPEISVLRSYHHCWLEITGVFLSVSLGIWAGSRLNMLIADPSLFPWSFMFFIAALHVSSAFLEALETWRSTES